MEGKSSLRDLEGLARTDLGCMWLTGGIQPDHSTIGRYICRHAEQFQGEGFLELTETLLEVIPHVDREVAGDGTILEAFASEVSKLEAEAAEQWAEETLDEEEGAQPQASNTDKADERASGSQAPKRGDSLGDGSQSKELRAKKLAELIDQRCEERSYHGGSQKPPKFSRTEPEAVWHRYKDGTYGFGYVLSIVANRQRFIVGQAMERTSETAVVEELLDQVEAVFSETVADETDESVIERLSLDNNYYTLEILEELVDRQIDALIYPDMWEPDEPNKLPKRGGKFAKEAFEYDADRDVYICPAGQQLEWIRSGTDRLGRKHHSYGRSPACEECPLREECTDSKEGRSVKRYDKDRFKEAMREVMAQPRAQDAYSRRMGIVEPIFPELRGRGLRRSKRRGMQGVATELALHSLGHNFDRFRVYLTSGRLEVSNLGTGTGLYTDALADDQAQPGLFGLNPAWHWPIGRTRAWSRQTATSPHRVAPPLTDLPARPPMPSATSLRSRPIGIPISG